MCCFEGSYVDVSILTAFDRSEVILIYLSDIAIVLLFIEFLQQVLYLGIDIIQLACDIIELLVNLLYLLQDFFYLSSLLSPRPNRLLRIQEKALSFASHIELPISLEHLSISESKIGVGSLQN